MGQDVSKPSLKLQRSGSSKHTHNFSGSKVRKISDLKLLVIKAESDEIEVEINDDNMTCGWLLSESIRLLNNNSIIALKTSRGIETLDAWLMDFERNLVPFKHREVLNPIYHSEIEQRICAKSFSPIKVIGKGGFSDVIQARKKDSGELFAIKIIQKQLIIKENKVEQLIIEKNILKESNSPFVVKLHWAYQTSTELHFVMDFCSGGELFYHLRKLGRFTEEQARFYISEILLALEYLHSREIVYRDLKPENVLLDLDGHIKITDFGLSKERITLSDLCSSFCGSPEYMSPEMLIGAGHGRAVDFYSLGALIFEMLVGVPPFYNKIHSVMYSKILQDEVSIPSFISNPCKDLLESLLNKDPGKRLGCHSGAKEIKDHPWFKGVNWARVLKKQQVPPYRPDFRKSNFDGEYLKANVNLESFSEERVLPDPVFRDFDFNVVDLEECAITDVAQNRGSPVEDYGVTKIKLFLPSVSPKILDNVRYGRLKEYDVRCFMEENRGKNLVQELRPVSQRINFRKGPKPGNQGADVAKEKS